MEITNVRKDWLDWKDEGRICIHKALKLPKIQPNLQGLKLIAGKEYPYYKSYPKTCKSDEQKFFHLSKWFMDNEVTEEMYVEFVDVLKFQVPNMEGKEQEMMTEFIEKKRFRTGNFGLNTDDF